ncbi:MAG: helicase associated domain-containing protein [Nitrospirales bacterium]
MEKVGERWHLRFGALQEYMNQCGKQPTSKSEFKGFKIGQWLQAQRAAHKKEYCQLIALNYWMVFGSSGNPISITRKDGKSI